MKEFKRARFDMVHVAVSLFQKAKTRSREMWILKVL
jgi:hypothetical protein